MLVNRRSVLHRVHAVVAYAIDATFAPLPVLDYMANAGSSQFIEYVATAAQEAFPERYGSTRGSWLDLRLTLRLDAHLPLVRSIGHELLVLDTDKARAVAEKIGDTIAFAARRSANRWALLRIASDYPGIALDSAIAFNFPQSIDIVDEGYSCVYRGARTHIARSLSEELTRVYGKRNKVISDAMLSALLGVSEEAIHADIGRDRRTPDIHVMAVFAEESRTAFRDAVSELNRSLRIYRVASEGNDRSRIMDIRREASRVERAYFAMEKAHAESLDVYITNALKGKGVSAQDAIQLSRAAFARLTRSGFFDAARYLVDRVHEHAVAYDRGYDGGHRGFSGLSVL